LTPSPLKDPTYPPIPLYGGSPPTVSPLSPPLFRGSEWGLIPLAKWVLKSSGRSQKNFWKNFGEVDYINLVFIIKNTMKKIVCLIVKKITFGKVCLGWCNL
jgi:hypothetical protein